MAASFRDGALLGLCLMAMVVVGSIGAEAQIISTNLTTQFYDVSCPQIYDIVKAEIQAAVANNTRNAAFLVRLHFHDCFVNGCDGSILLNSTNSDNNNSEQCAAANVNSIHGLDIIDTIKAKLEAACPQTVSCADTLAIAYRDSAVEVGLSPGYPVFFGRRDSLNFSQAQANLSLPSPFSVYADLVTNFRNVGLDEVDLATLSGGHTIGRVNCSLITNPLLDNSTDSEYGFNPVFHQNNIDTCNALLTDNQSHFLNLDHTTPDFWDNWYYKNLLDGEGALGSDQTLFSTVGSIGQELVAKFAFDPAAFAAQFVLSSIKMGNISPLTGDEGEIRVLCGVINNATSPNATVSSPSGPAPTAPSLVASQ